MSEGIKFDGKQSEQSKYVIVIQETNAFFIKGFSTPAGFEQDKAAIDEVIHSFHLE